MNGSGELVKMTVDGDLVRNVVEKQVVAAVAAEFGKYPDLIEKVVQTALRLKVDCNGNQSSYSGDNRYDFVEILCKKSIQDCAIEAAKSWVEENRPALVAAVKKQMTAKKGEFTKQFVETLDKSLKSYVSVSCSLNFSKE